MLTPRFKIVQNDEEITVTIHAPYTNIKDTEVYVDGTDFRFYSTPYYLRLNLPGEIVENDSSSGSYDCEKGDFTLRFSKVNKGEYFENLDMITVLLASKSETKKDMTIPNIEVIGNPSVNSDLNESLNGNINGTKPDSGDEWFVPQNNPVDYTILLTGLPKYGFANKISGALTAFEEAWIKEIINLPSPDTTLESERKGLREKCELEDFNEEHYMADLMQTEYIEPYITYTTKWDTLQIDEIAFSEADVDLLKELPSKEYLLEDEDVKKLYLNLVDILYASCYNHRTTLGENTVESSWTINKLSSTLCWFQNFTTMDEVITACFRRSLIYPLFRNWELSVKVLEDVKNIIKLGKKFIIICFCEIYRLFNNSYEPRYLLNQLYIKDFLIWLQLSSESLIESLYPILDNIHPKKIDMGLELLEIEEAAYSVQEDALVIENAVHEMVEKIDELAINANGDTEKDKPKNVYYLKRKQFFKYLLSNGSSSTDTSDTDAETDSESSTTSSSSSTSNSSLDSDDLSDPE